MHEISSFALCILENLTPLMINIDVRHSITDMVCAVILTLLPLQSMS